MKTYSQSSMVMLRNIPKHKLCGFAASGISLALAGALIGIPAIADSPVAIYGAINFTNANGTTPFSEAKVTLVSSSGATWVTYSDGNGNWSFIQADIADDVCEPPEADVEEEIDPVIDDELDDAIDDDSDDLDDEDLDNGNDNKGDDYSDDESDYDSDEDEIIESAAFRPGFDMAAFRLPADLNDDVADDDLDDNDEDAEPPAEDGPYYCTYQVVIDPTDLGEYVLLAGASPAFSVVPDGNEGIIQSRFIEGEEVTAESAAVELNATYAPNPAVLIWPSRARALATAGITASGTVTTPAGTFTIYNPILAWQETFSSGSPTLDTNGNPTGTVPSNTSTAPLSILDYIGQGLSAPYTASPFWTPAANLCNGWILNATTIVNTGTNSKPNYIAGFNDTGCQGTNGGQDGTGTKQPAWYYLQYMAYVLGTQAGMSSSDAIYNNALAAETNPASGTNYSATGNIGNVEFEMVPSVAAGSSPATGLTAQPGHFYTVSAEFAAMHCSGGTTASDSPGATTDQLKSWNDAHEQLYLTTNDNLTGWIVTPSGGVDPCVAGVMVPSSNGTVAGAAFGANVGAVFVDNLVGNQAYQIDSGATQLGITLTNATTATSGNDVAFDNPTIMDVTPSIYKQFSPSLIPPNGTSTLTITIVNTSDLRAKCGTIDANGDCVATSAGGEPGWSFTDVMPPAVEFADDPNPTVTCSGGPTYSNEDPSVGTITTGGLQSISVSAYNNPATDDPDFESSDNTNSAPALEVSGNLLAGQTYCQITVQVQPVEGEFTPEQNLTLESGDRVSIANSIYVPGGNVSTDPTTGAITYGECGTNTWSNTGTANDPVWTSAGTNPNPSAFATVASPLPTFDPTVDGTASGLVGCPGGILKVGIPPTQVDVSPPTIGVNSSGQTTLTWTVTVLNVSTDETDTDIDLSVVLSTGSLGGTDASGDPLPNYQLSGLTWNYDQCQDLIPDGDGGYVATTPSSTSGDDCSPNGTPTSSTTPTLAADDPDALQFTNNSNPTSTYDVGGDYIITSLNPGSAMSVTITAVVSDGTGPVSAEDLLNSTLLNTQFVATAGVIHDPPMCSLTPGQWNPAPTDPSTPAVPMCRSIDVVDPTTGVISNVDSVLQDSDQWDQEVTVLPVPSLSLVKTPSTTQVGYSGGIIANPGGGACPNLANGVAQADGDWCYPAGTIPPVITYTFTITNTGNVILQGIDLKDLLIPSFENITCSVNNVIEDASDDFISSLAPPAYPGDPNATATCTAAYPISATDIANRDNENAPGTTSAYEDDPGSYANVFPGLDTSGLVPDNQFSDETEGTADQPLGVGCPAAWNNLQQVTANQFYPNGPGPNGYLYNNAIAIGSPNYLVSADGTYGQQVTGTSTDANGEVSTGTAITSSAGYYYPNDVNCPSFTSVQLLIPSDFDTLPNQFPLPLTGVARFIEGPWLYVGLLTVASAVALYLHRSRRSAVV